MEWIDLTRAIAVAGLCLSLVNLYFTWQSRVLAREQERRRLPRLVPSLIRAFYEDNIDVGTRTYAFLITITNPTDNNNAIAEADLAISYYLSSDRTEITAKVRSSGVSDSKVVKNGQIALATPASISAHSAISGWLIFQLPASLLAGTTIRSCRVILTDPHREEASFVPILVQERLDET